MCDQMTKSSCPGLKQGAQQGWLEGQGLAVNVWDDSYESVVRYGHEKAQVSSSVSLARNSNSHVSAVVPWSKRLCKYPYTSLDRYHGVGAVSIEKEWANPGFNGQILILSDRELAVWFFSALFLLTLQQLSLKWERALWNGGCGVRVWCWGFGSNLKPSLAEWVPDREGFLEGC